jgi:hypothetical protein
MLVLCNRDFKKLLLNSLNYVTGASKYVSILPYQIEIFFCGKTNMETQATVVLCAMTSDDTRRDRAS